MYFWFYFFEYTTKFGQAVEFIFTLLYTLLACETTKKYFLFLRCVRLSRKIWIRNFFSPNNDGKNSHNCQFVVNIHLNLTNIRFAIVLKSKTNEFLLLLRTSLHVTNYYKNKLVLGLFRFTSFNLFTLKFYRNFRNENFPLIFINLKPAKRNVWKKVKIKTELKTRMLTKRTQRHSYRFDWIEIHELKRQVNF